jgi:hypothetical protein
VIPYRFLSPAEEEMTEAALFYESALVGLGTDFLNDVQRAVNRVLDYPQIGQPIDGDLRRTLLHRFPFSLIYTISEDGIVIVAIAHYGRTSGYWRSRLN